MKTSIVGKNIKITSAMSSSITKKMERISRLFEDPEKVEATVLVSTCKDDQFVEIAVNTGLISLRVKVKDTDMYAALDHAIDRLEGQMRKVKTQITNKKKHRNLVKNINFDYLDDYEDELPDIVKRKTLTLVPMDVDEAITRMEALNHQFFIYLDSETGLTNVLYERNDGTFGVIEINE